MRCFATDTITCFLPLLPIDVDFERNDFYYLLGSDDHPSWKFFRTYTQFRHSLLDGLLESWSMRIKYLSSK